MEEATFYQRLSKAQMELKVPKGQNNDYGNYKYRSAEDIEEAVKPVNEANGLHLYLSDEVVEIGGKNYVKATATITDICDIANVHTVTAFAREAETKKGMDDSQITGAASSYARKYALNGMYLIDDTKDADTNEYRDQHEKGKKKAKGDKEQEFYQNKKEFETRLKKVASKVGKSYEQLEKYVIYKSNEKMNKKYTNINSQNIGMAVGYVKVLENQANKKEQENKQQSMMQGNTTNPVDWGN